MIDTSDTKIDRWRTALASSSIFLLLIVAFAAETALADWKPVGSVVRILEQRANYAVLQTSAGARVRVEFFDQNIVRIRLTPGGDFEPASDYALDLSIERQTPLVKLTQTREKIVLANALGARIEIGKTPLLITVFDENGEVVVRDAKQMAFDTQTGEISAVKNRRSVTETYYGFGEKALSFSRDQQSVTNWNTDAYGYRTGNDLLYQSIPFFIALERGKVYGLYFNNTYRTSFDMGKSALDKYSFAAQGGELDYFVLTGGKERSPQKILEDYSSLTGKMPLPPVWALGNHQSRFSYFPESRVREIADGFRRRRIPCDAIYIDIDFMDGFRVFTWNKVAFPNPRKLTDDLRASGFKSVVIVDPAIKIDDNYSVYREGKTKDFYIKSPDGSNFVGQVWAGKSVFPDFVNPQARQWFGGLYRGFIDDGIDGFWNDMNEPSNFPDGELKEPIVANHPQKTLPVDALHFGGGRHARFHNVYGSMMARSTFEGVRKLRPEKRPFVLTRAGFAGVQRYAAVWTGDNTASWEHLKLSVPMLLNMSVSGVPMVGADVGGYAGVPSGELYARWLQAASLTPFLRSHSEKDTANKETWEFGDDLTNINRASIELRYQLLPYLYTLYYEHERSGHPVMRPLWYEYPRDYRTYLIDDQYLVGRDLLVAPVLSEGQRKRTVYFPAGDDWRDWQTGEIYQGGTFAQIEAPLEKLPVYARVGAVIPTQTVVQSTSEMPRADLTLNVVTGIAPEKSETSRIYQDAGDGYDYRRSARREITVEHRKGLLRIEYAGNFEGQKIRYVEALGIAKRPSEMRVDGKLIDEIDVNEKRNRLKIKISDNAREISLIP